MQKFPLRNRPRRSTAVGFGGSSSVNGMTKECRGISAVTTRAAPATKPGSVRICNRVLARNEDMVTWDEVLIVGGKSKSWQSQASSSQVDSCGTAPAAVTTQGPMQQQQQQHVPKQTSARLLQVPCTATAATTSSSSINNNNNNNMNKDDDDNNRRNGRTMGAAPREGPAPGPAPAPEELRLGAAAKAEATATPAGAYTAREFMTFEQLRLGDQINFLLFDPYRTLKFLITELKSRLRVVAPGDINAHKILVEIQQAVKRIRVPNATPTKATTTRTAGTTGAAPMPVGCIPPLGRCHVIKEDPLINHARQVNSSCQTMESQLENVNACQMCEERQVGPGWWCAPGCNQKRMNGNSNADDAVDDVRMCAAKPHQRSKDHRQGADAEKRFNYKSRQEVDSILKARSSNLIADNAQRIIAQLEAELLDIQGGGVSQIGGDFTALSSPPPPPRIGSAAENSKVQCKRRPNEHAEYDTPEQPEGDQEDAEEQKGTFSNFNASLPPQPKHDSCTQAAADTSSKEAQASVNKNPTQLLCHLEREKLLLLQQFRAAELQHIQGDLNELHVFIKDQLNGIYHSITRESLQTKYPPRCSGSKKSRQTTTMGVAVPPTTEQASSSSTPSLTAQTSSSALSSSELLVDLPVTTPESFAANGNANIPKSMMKQKHLQKLSSALDAKDPRDISAVDEANKTTGEKKSKDHHSRHLRQHRHFSHAKCCAGTPCWSGNRIHYSAVECGGCCRRYRAPTAELARTSIHRDAKSTTKTSLAAMTHHQQCQHQPMTTATTTTTMSAAQEQTQLMAPLASRSQPAAAPQPRPQPCTVPEERVELSLDGMTNAPVGAIIAKPISADRSNRIWGHRHSPHCQSEHSWQCVNPKNPTCCQLKKQFCGNVHEPKLNENKNHLTSGNASSGNDSHSNYRQIHGCQQCRATAAVDWCCGLCPAPVHEVGMDNSAGAPSPRDGGAKGGGVDDVRAGGDDGLNYGRTSGVGDLILHIGQRKPANLHSKPMTEAFQTDFDQFKEFLDEIILSTPRIK